MIKVIQAVNTTDYDRIDGCSCIEYWRNNKPDRDSSTCRFTGSQATPDDTIVGGHVIGIIDHSPHVYIVPMLNSVNLTDDSETYDVNENDLVRVPYNDEQEILSDPENKNRISILKIRRIKELM